MGRCGRRVLCAVQAGVGIAFWAISTLAARSTGVFAVRRPARMAQDRRSDAGSPWHMARHLDAPSLIVMTWPCRAASPGRASWALSA